MSDGGFLGIDDRVGAVPASSTGALGDSWFVSAVTPHVGVFGPVSGALRAGWPIRLRSLRNALPNGAVESAPRVVFDHYAKRFVLVYVAQDRASNPTRSWIVVATARDETADDPSAWCVRKINGDQTPRDAKQRATQPALGFTGDRVTIATDQRGIKGAKFHYAQVLAFPKGSLYGGCGELQRKVFAGDRTRDPHNERGVGLQPMQTYGGSSPQVQYLVSFQGSIRGERVVLWRLKRGGGGLKLARAAKRVAPVAVAPYGTQADGGLGDPDTFWDTGDLRFGPSVYDVDADRITAAHTIRRDVGGAGYVESAVRWYQVRPDADLGASVVTAHGTIAIEDRDLAWPAVATTAGGTIVATYVRAGLLGGGEYLSAYATDIVGGTIDGTVRLRAGQARYQAGPGVDPWGGTSAANRDPGDAERVAVTSQFAESDGSGATDLWRQWLDVLAPT
ncbi:MAG: hypothetical protein WEA10_10590 [Actinomycetota bacterium]